MFQKNLYKKTIYIKGMHCTHCVKRVKDTLTSLKGVKVEINLEEGKAILESKKEIENTLLQTIITDIGYEVDKIE